MKDVQDQEQEVSPFQDVVIKLYNFLQICVTGQPTTVACTLGDQTYKRMELFGVTTISCVIIILIKRLATDRIPVISKEVTGRL